MEHVSVYLDDGRQWLLSAWVPPCGRPGMTRRSSVVSYDWPRTCRRKCRAAYSSVIKLEATPPGERPVDLCHTTCYPPVILRNTGLHYLSRKRSW